MKKSRKDPVREDRIHNEAIVDAGPEEQALSWYYYLENKISFPFEAKCLAAKVVSPLKKGESLFPFSGTAMTSSAPSRIRIGTDPPAHHSFKGVLASLARWALATSKYQPSSHALASLPVAKNV
jgi:hypothetical protein